MSIKTRHQLFGPMTGLPHNEALYKTFNLLIQPRQRCRETKNPQAFSRLRIALNVC
jgi:hypothetical protein